MHLLGLLATVMTTAKRLPPSGHAAAGLTMIISMNATVCGDMNHGEKRQFKIAGSDWGRRAQRGDKGAVNRGNLNFKLRAKSGVPSQR